MQPLHWVATGLLRPQIAGSIAPNPLEFKCVFWRQTENKPRQAKKLNSGRVALGCRILCFLCCLLFQASQKKPQLQNEPNFKIKPKLNRFFKMQPNATLDFGCIPALGSWIFSGTWSLGFRCSKLTPIRLSALLSPVKPHKALLSSLEKKRLFIWNYVHYGSSLSPPRRGEG